MQIAICSWSFHRLLAAGKQDIFQYIKDCKELGCTHLDPWNGHLVGVKAGDQTFLNRQDPTAPKMLLTDAERAYVSQVKAAADAAGMPFGCIAADGCHIFDADLAKRTANRARAYRWIEVCTLLGARQIRIDAGGPADMPPDAYAVIKEGFLDLIARAKARGVEMITENHIGPTNRLENVLKIMTDIPTLGLLWDSHNWQPQTTIPEARQQTVRFAKATHFKTFTFDDAGNEITPGADVAGAMQLLKDSGYRGCWGVESVPKDGDEIGAARKTIALIKKIAD